MTTQDDELLGKLRSTFQVEAEEHLHAISSGLLELENVTDRQRRTEIVLSIFREAHSLKGAARVVNLREIEAICQSLESVFSTWRQDPHGASADTLDTLHAALDLIASKLPTPSVGEKALHALENVSTVLNRLAGIGTCAAAGGEPLVRTGPESASATAHEPAPHHDAGPSAASAAPVGVPGERTKPATPVEIGGSTLLRIASAKLDALLLRAEEFLAIKVNAHQHRIELRGLLEAASLCERDWTKVVSDCRAFRSAEVADVRPARVPRRAESAWGASLNKLAESVDAGRASLAALRGRLSALVRSAEQDGRFTAGLVDSLLEDCKELLLLPFSTLFARFPKLVRDLARDQQKQVRLEITGAEIEVDKRILEALTDPLMHVIRNGIDHGIESPSKRAEAGKPPAGTLAIAVSRAETSSIEILVSDDGVGIDRQAVRDAAARKNVRTEEELRALGDDGVLNLVFESDVSTNATITEISGRGLGLAIVKETVERLGGGVSLETHPGGGTAFRLRVPLTLATFRGILVGVTGQVYVLPTTNVQRVLRVSAGAIQTVKNRETIQFEGTCTPIVWLADVLELPRPPIDPARWITAVVLGLTDRRVAFRVDAVTDEREVLVKPLAPPLVRVRNVASATVLGSGKAAAILNVADLLESASRGRFPVRAAASATAGQRETTVKAILVVDDSITARMLLKNVLESAGYRVKTAVDGVDALALLRCGSYDLLVSDVEMPRMDGFELTAKLRDDKRLCELPVVLVTARSSPEDRERGVDAGADAYIVKSSFDQSDLLDVVRRLV